MTAAQFTYQGYYVADTFQVSKRLTLNYGVRWDLPGAYTERYNNESVWLPNVPSVRSRNKPVCRSWGNWGWWTQPNRQAEATQSNIGNSLRPV